MKSFAIITMTANALLAPLHARMPAVIPPDCWGDWLGENSVPESEVKTLLRPYPEQAMAFWAVDRRVGNVRNDSPDLFAPWLVRNDVSQAISKFPQHVPT